MAFERSMKDTEGDDIFVERTGPYVDIGFLLYGGVRSVHRNFDRNKLLEFKKIIDAAYKELDV